MSARHWLVGAALIVMAAPELGAQGVSASPRFERVVAPGAAGPNRLGVDSTLLVGASPFEPSHVTRAPITRAGLGELRLFDDPAGREVPYLFVWPASTPPDLWQGARVVPVSPRKDTSGFEIDLGKVTTVDRFNMDGIPLGLLKRVRLEGSGDRVRWIVLVAEGTIFNLPVDADGRSAAMRQSVLAFPPATVRYLRLTADDHAGAPLPVPRLAMARIATPRLAEPDTLRSLLAFERRPSAKRTSRYHVQLPATRLPIVALELEASGDQILRGAVVTEPRLRAGHVEPEALGSTVLRRTTRGDAVASNLRVPIDLPTGGELDLVIDDGDNPPLDIRAVRAVYAPLPYIFFVSDSGRPIRATYGSDRRAPVASPQYDLEVLRDTVQRIATTLAAWGPATAINAVAAQPEAPATLYADPGAPLDTKGFRFARAIPDGTGLTAVRLDAAALAHSHITDVRIVDESGRQVPYLLEALGEPTELALTTPQAVKPRFDVNGQLLAGANARTWYRLALPLTGLPDATLRLETSARVFERDIAVVTRELPRDTRQLSTDRVVDMPWTHDDPDIAAPPVEIGLEAQRLASDSLFVLVNDGDNQKLPLTRATILLPTYRLRFFRQAGTSLHLVYGRDDLAAPRYDIALLAPRLLDAAASEVLAAPEHGNAVNASPVPQRAFWATLAAAVAVLLVLIARLVRAGPGPTPEDVQA
ncbi:MAG TPA: discoidin domain-containing protein [Gemmatimonadaceae bacterium]|nr:discoidin domain-containing protein [Gemmatimonadaceae bacterium]